VHSAICAVVCSSLHVHASRQQEATAEGPSSHHRAAAAPPAARTAVLWTSSQPLDRRPPPRSGSPRISPSHRLAAALPRLQREMAAPRRKRIACVVTTYFTNSHADVIVGKFIRGFPTDEGLLPPEVDVVSLYMDQLSTSDVGVALLRRHGIRLCSTINEALCLDTGKLCVDGVLSIGEHGSYAHNEFGQLM
jgi:hypothetical protein